MLQDLVELQFKRDAMEARMADDDTRAPGDPPPRVLLGIRKELEERRKRLVELVGAEGAEVLQAHLTDPAVREALGVTEVETEDAIREEAGGDEVAARVYRRKMESRHVAPLRGTRGEAAAVTHDALTSTGSRSLVNQLATSDPEEGLSYYQKQQLKYGRARRGSTSVAGAWESLYGSDVAEVPDGSTHRAARGPGDTHTIITTAPLQRSWTKRGLMSGGGVEGGRGGGGDLSGLGSGSASMVGGFPSYARGGGGGGSGGGAGLASARSSRSPSRRGGEEGGPSSPGSGSSLDVAAISAQIAAAHARGDSDALAALSLRLAASLGAGSGR
jgi:hypothetical protein